MAAAAMTPRKIGPPLPMNHGPIPLAGAVTSQAEQEEWNPHARMCCKTCHQRVYDLRHGHAHDYVGDLGACIAGTPCLACNKPHVPLSPDEYHALPPPAGREGG